MDNLIGKLKETLDEQQTPNGVGPTVLATSTKAEETGQHTSSAIERGSIPPLSFVPRSRSHPGLGSEADDELAVDDELTPRPLQQRSPRNELAPISPSIMSSVRHVDSCPTFEQDEDEDSEEEFPMRSKASSVILEDSMDQDACMEEEESKQYAEHDFYFKDFDGTHHEDGFIDEPQSDPTNTESSFSGGSMDSDDKTENIPFTKDMQLKAIDSRIVTQTVEQGPQDQRDALPNSPDSIEELDLSGSDGAVVRHLKYTKRKRQPPPTDQQIETLKFKNDGSLMSRHQNFHIVRDNLQLIKPRHEVEAKQITNKINKTLMKITGTLLHEHDSLLPSPLSSRSNAVPEHLPKENMLVRDCLTESRTVIQDQSLKLSATERELQATKSKIEALQETHEKTKSFLSKVQSKMEELEKRTMSGVSGKEGFTELHGRYRELNGDYSELYDKYKLLCKEFIEQAKELDAKLDENKEMSEQLDATRKQYEGEIIRLQQNHASLEVEHGKLTEEMHDMKRKLQKTQSEAYALEQDVLAKEGEIQQIQSNAKKIEIDLQHQKTQTDGFDQAELRKLELRLRDIEVQKERAEHELDRARISSKQVVEDLVEAGVTIEKLSENINNQDINIEALKQQKQIIESEAAQLKNWIGEHDRQQKILAQIIRDWRYGPEDSIRRTFKTFDADWKAAFVEMEERSKLEIKNIHTPEIDIDLERYNYMRNRLHEKTREIRRIKQIVAISEQSSKEKKDRILYLEDLVSSLEGELHEANDRASQLQRDHFELTAEFSQLATAHAEYPHELILAKAETQAREKDIAKLREEIIDLQLQLVETEIDKQTLIEEKLLEQSELDHEKILTIKHVDQLETELREAKQKVKDAEFKLESQELKLEFEQTRSLLAFQKDDSKIINELLRDNQRLNNEYLDLQQNSQWIVDQNDKMSKDMEDMKTALSQIAKKTDTSPAVGLQGDIGSGTFGHDHFGTNLQACFNPFSTSKMRFSLSPNELKSFCNRSKTIRIAVH